MVHKVNDEEFLTEIENNEKVVVKFYADWCGNCRLFSPKYNRMSDKTEFEGIKFLDVNAEKSPGARKIADVKNLPTFAVFRNGELVKTDFTSREEVVEAMIKTIQA